MVKKKPKKSTLKNKLDKKVGALCRSKGYCERCGNREQAQIQWCHVSSRQYLSTRWDPDNYLAMCASCHFWQHKNPTLWTEWFNEKFPGRMKRLHEKLQKGETWDVGKMLKLYETL